MRNLMQICNSRAFEINHNNWEPEYSFEETMGDLLEYWRDLVYQYGDQFFKGNELSFVIVAGGLEQD